MILRPIQLSAIIPHTMLHYPLMQIAVHFSSSLPSLFLCCCFVCTCASPERLQCAPQTGRSRRTIQAHKGQNRRVETSPFTNTNFVIQKPKLTGAFNAPTPARLNQIVLRSSTTHCGGGGSNSCPIAEDPGTKPCTNAAQPSLPGLRYLVQPYAACVFGDQTQPRGCTCCTRLSHSISIMFTSAH